MSKTKNFKIGQDCIGVGAGALILNDLEQILLTLRGKAAKNEVGKWELPGGAVEFGETIEQALKREVKEELKLSQVTKQDLQAFAEKFIL